MGRYEHAILNFDIDNIIQTANRISSLFPPEHLFNTVELLKICKAYYSIAMQRKT